MEENKKYRDRIKGAFHGMGNNVKSKYQDFRSLSSSEKRRKVTDTFLNNAMFIMIVLAVIIIAIMKPRFLSVASIINIISLTAARLPIALGIGGAIELTGTDISAGRAVGLTACISAALLQSADYSAKIFPNLNTFPIAAVILSVIIAGALVGLVNGFFVAKFKLHQFIVTLSTQLIIY